MASPYGPILTGVGLLEKGKLTEAGRTRYVDEVIGLLITGNADGTGGLPTTKIFSSLVPLPPVPGPTIFNVTTLQPEQLFWFGPDPVAALLATQLRDRAATPIWNSVFPDLLYGNTASALDANGSTPLFPLFDVSVPFPDLSGFPIALPDLAASLSLIPPKLLIKLADLGIKLSPPSIPLPPIPPELPNFLPTVPGLQIPGLPTLDLPALLLGLIKMPFDLLLKLVLPPNIGLVLDLIALKFDGVFNLAFDIVVKLLEPFLLIVPKVVIASILIYVKNIVSMAIVDIVGLLIGAGGVITKTVAGATGLI